VLPSEFFLSRISKRSPFIFSKKSTFFLTLPLLFFGQPKANIFIHRLIFFLYVLHTLASKYKNKPFSINDNAIHFFFVYDA